MAIELATNRLPSAPKTLHAAGKAAWELLAALPEGWIAPSDMTLVQAFCETVDIRAQLMAVIQKEGVTTKSTKNTTMIHPALREIRNVNADLLAMQRQLALTPVARLRFGLDQLSAAQKQSELDAFLSEIEEAIPFEERRLPHG